MPMQHFNFEPTTIGKLLKGGGLMVPPNQRSYSWEEQHVQNLLHDFDGAVDDKDDYFLGTVVLVQGDRRSIQDGQQRLATVSLLMARIRDKLMELKREGSAASIDQEFIRSIDRTTEERVARMALNAEDNHYFAQSAIASPGDDQYADRPKPDRQSHLRLARASEVILQFLEDKLKPMSPDRRVPWLLSWTDFVENSASVVAVTVSDEVNAYRVFETLNDRGLKASQADILKNYFFSKVGDRLPEAQAMWNAIATSIEGAGGSESDRMLLTYLRHFWVTRHGPTKERELAASIRTETTGQAQTMQFLMDSSRAVQTYLALGSSGHPRWATYSSSVRQNIDTIAIHLQVEQIRPLLFAVALHFSPDEAEKAFRLFVSWSVRFLVAGGRGGMLDQQYSLRAQEVGTGKVTKARELRDAMKQYVPSDKEFEDAFASARVSRPHLARYYLRAIEKTAVADPHPEYVANTDVQDVTLEHIVPINPSDDWGIDEETARAAQKMLGNMVLIRSSDNVLMGNGAYPAKRAVLLKSAFKTTREAAAPERWTVEAIRSRQANQAQVALKTWALGFD